MNIVYVLTFNPSGTQYVGSTSQTAKGRLTRHLSAMRTGRHPNPGIKATVEQYGVNEDDWTIEVVGEFADRATAREKEAELTALLLDAGEPLFNVYQGSRKDEETKKAMSEARTGKPRNVLTADDVVEIRHLVTTEEYSSWGGKGRLAARYGISQATLSNLLAGRIWGDV